VPANDYVIFFVISSIGSTTTTADTCCLLPTATIHVPLPILLAVIFAILQHEHEYAATHLRPAAAILPAILSTTPTPVITLPLFTATITYPKQ